MQVYELKSVTEKKSYLESGRVNLSLDIKKEFEYNHKNTSKIAALLFLSFDVITIDVWWSTGEAFLFLLDVV